MVKRRSCRITDPAVKVRVLPGARTACSSSGRAPFSRNGGSRFDTCRADRCLDPESEGPGRDPGISGSVTRQAPPGRADHVARTPGRKPVASAVQVRLLPRPLPPPPPRQRRTSLAAESAAGRPKPGCPSSTLGREAARITRSHARVAREPSAKRCTLVRFQLRPRLPAEPWCSAVACPRSRSTRKSAHNADVTPDSSGTRNRAHGRPMT